MSDQLMSPFVQCFLLMSDGFCCRHIDVLFMAKPLRSKFQMVAVQGGITGAFQKVGEKIPGTTAWNDAHGKYDSPTHDLGPVGQTRQGAEGTAQLSCDKLLHATCSDTHPLHSPFPATSSSA